jgi:hypothetical protein
MVQAKEKTMKRKFFAVAILMLALVPFGAVKAGAPTASTRTLLATQQASASTQPLTPVGSGFTYQGRLLDGGNPANGTYDLRFTLFDALTGGSQVGSPLTLSSQTVTNGLFTVTLDFGTTAFRGAARFMQIEVQHNGGGFVLLAPRQPLTPAPYAMSLMPGAVISATTNSNVLTAVNNGAGVALKGTGTGGSGVEGDSTSGIGVAGYTSSSTSGALAGLNFGSGPGVAAVSVNGTGVSASSINGIGVSANSTNSTAVNAQGKTAGVYGVGTDVGAAGVRGVANSGTGAAGLYGYSTSGYGAQGISGAANGTGVYGVDNNTGSSGVAGTSSFGYGVYGTGSTGVRGETAAGGNGISGLSPSGNGVIGTGTSGTGANGTTNTGTGVKGQAFASGGTGVKATGIGSGTAALWIDNGSIRVTNAGNETTSTVFQHIVHTGTGGNTCQSNGFSILDNPYANGDPNAILVVTPMEYIDNPVIPHSVFVAYAATPLFDCPGGRWLVSPTTANTFGNLESYNVMVIKP